MRHSIPHPIGPGSARANVQLEARYLRLLRLAWRVGWIPARDAYVRNEDRRGRDAEEVRGELALFDSMHRTQSDTGVDPIAALRQRDLAHFVTRPLAIIIACGVAAIAALAGFDGSTATLQAALTFGFIDASGRALIASTVR